jgi:hypothetical protein
VGNITRLECAGMIWLRDNTEKTAIVMSDRYSHIRAPKNFRESSFFSYSAYSERRIYLEGYRATQAPPEEVERRKALVDDTLRNDRDSFIALTNENVEYFIKTLRVNPDFEPPADLTEMVFANEHIVIYRVTK